MKFSDIIADVRSQIQETDPNNSHFTDPQLLTWGNDCTLQLISLIGTYPKVSVSGITAAKTITFDENLLCIDYAAILTPTGKHSILTPWDFANFAKLHPNWEDQDANRPSEIIRMDSVTWMLYPEPDADYLGKALSIYGKKLPAVATTYTEEPPVSIALHSCYAPFIAWKCFLGLNNDVKAAQAFNMYDGLRKLNLRTATNTTGSLLNWRLGNV